VLQPGTLFTTETVKLVVDTKVSYTSSLGQVASYNNFPTEKWTWLVVRSSWETDTQATTVAIYLNNDLDGSMDYANAGIIDDSQNSIAYAGRPIDGEVPDFSGFFWSITID
jgi:hypothetical protein